MAKLHELLAVESDLEGIHNKIIDETRKSFTRPELYFGMEQTVRFLDKEEQETSPEAPTHKKMDDTVQGKLNYTFEHIQRYLDAVLQKEVTNQIAAADLVVDGVTISQNVPVTFLLGLETKLKHIRDKVYAAIPTLQAGVNWVEYPEMGEDVVQRKDPEQRWRTKKVRQNHVLAAATDKHPAQVEVYTEDVKVAEVLTYTWCSTMSPAQKSALLGRLDKLIRAVKKARQQANTTDVIERTIGSDIYNYLHP